MVMDFVMPGPQCGEQETRPAILYAVHYTYFSVISFVVTSLVLVSISLITKPQDNTEVIYQSIIKWVDPDWIQVVWTPL